MYFLIGICENPDILRILFFINKLLDIVFLIVPIGLIIMIIIDIFKNVINPEEKETNKNIKTIITRLIFAVLMFFVPVIVSAVVNILDTSGVRITYIDEETNKEVSYKTCLDNSESLSKINGTFQDKWDKYQEEQDKKRKEELEQKVNEE